MGNKYYNTILFAYVWLSTTPAFAVFKKAQKLMEKVETGLRGLSLVTVTIAVLWVGYKLLFGGNTIRECTPIIIGTIVIASAAELAKLMV
jgi:type IV secretion system protein VirB2